jgi:hypothetical protein
MRAVDPKIARRLWSLFEPIHAATYFNPEMVEIYKAAGLKGGWMGYFASRTAAMGAVSSDVVVATFYNFHPNMVRRAIPDAWTFSTPEKILAARREVAKGVLERAFGTRLAEEVSAASKLAGRAVELARPEGRPLFAAHARLPVPDDTNLALWHYATCLREHRGDGHVACLVEAGINGLEANVMMTAAAGVPPEMQRQFRGWSEEEWADAEDRLRGRGLYDGGRLTDEGRALRERIETRTDELAIQPFEEMGEVDTERFETHLRPLYAAVTALGAVPYPNPMGLPPIEAER